MTLADGDYDTHGLGSGSDLIFLSAIVHSNAPQGNRDLIRKAAAALNASGQFVVQGFILAEAQIGSPFGILFAPNMLVGTDGGDTYTESEVRG